MTKQESASHVLGGKRSALALTLSRGDLPTPEMWSAAQISQKQHALYYQLRLVLPPADAIRRAISEGN